MRAMYHSLPRFLMTPVCRTPGIFLRQRGGKLRQAAHVEVLAVAGGLCRCVSTALGKLEAVFSLAVREERGRSFYFYLALRSSVRRRFFACCLLSHATLCLGW